MSMYRQLWLAIIVSMLLALAGSLLASMLSARAYLESQLSIKNSDNAAALALSLSQSEPDAVSVELTVSALFDSGHYELIRVVDPKGEIVVERSAPRGEVDAPEWFVSQLPILATPGQAQISDGWKQFGTITLVSNKRFAYGALWNSALQMMMALTIACAFGGYLGSLILRRLKRPLQAVIDQATAISERRFITIDEPKVPELRKLASAMNTTVGRLKTLFEEETARLERVRREANFDPLTGLANRTHFVACLRQSLDAEDGFGGTLLLIRLADLAGINRRLGREAADELLKHAADAIRLCSKLSPEGIAGRLNGADFAVMLPGEVSGRASAASLLARLSEVARPFVDGKTTASIGFCRFTHGMDLGALLARADRALASAEAEGIDSIREAEADDGDVQPRSAKQWTDLIHRALDNGWVRLISFPVADFSGQLLHRECPLRLMFDEQGEWLPAGQFLPVAERLRLTPRLDLAAVTLGLRELTTHPELPGLAINLSASSICDDQFRTSLLALLTSDRRNASRLWLEVAENGALRHIGEFRALCLKLKAAGCRVGLEHFGHHFSQIGQLHDLGLDFLKIDSSFVRGLEGNPGNAAFLKGLCSIAHAIGLQVLAEGVATTDEMETLKSIGFDGVTGPVLV
jgi:diguanylate cyclase (GGDEF)-like protein